MKRREFLLHGVRPARSRCTEFRPLLVRRHGAKKEASDRIHLGPRKVSCSRWLWAPVPTVSTAAPIRPAS